VNSFSGGLHAGGVTGTVIASDYRAFAALVLIAFAANTAKIFTFSVPAKL
jgi:hypothetical protein